VPSSPLITVLGVDGRRGGWAVAAVTADGAGVRSLAWHTVPGQDAAGFRAVLQLAERLGATAVGVDCPIGLPADTWRACDLAAKARLGRASARVFLAPPRAVLAAPDYATARVVARAVLHGRGVSAQAYGIRRVVLAVDEVLAAGPPPCDVVEVHPELSFAALAGAAGALPSKRTPAGRDARIAALAAQLRPGLPFDPPDGDDHLDALAAAWSAWRWAAGRADVLGGAPDERGLPMRILI
jgi:predicted RNase H-like nuclease